jgi:hypothetical protein
MKTKKRAGRPSRELAPGERVPMSFRVTPALKQKMDALASTSGRSVAQEIEGRLELTALIDRMGAGLRIMMQVFMEFDRAGSKYAREWEVEGDWTLNPEVYRMAIEAAVARLCYLTPGPWDGNGVHGMVEQGFIRAQTTRVREAGGEIEVAKDGTYTWRFKE